MGALNTFGEGEERDNLPYNFQYNEGYNEGYNDGRKSLKDEIKSLRTANAALSAENERLRKIECAAVEVMEHPEWQGDDWYDAMWRLKEVL